MITLPLKNTFYSAIIQVILKISQGFSTNNNNFKVKLIESLSIDRDHSLFNNNRQPLLLELFDSWGTKFYHMVSRAIDSFGVAHSF